MIFVGIDSLRQNCFGKAISLVLELVSDVLSGFTIMKFSYALIAIVLATPATVTRTRTELCP